MPQPVTEEAEVEWLYEDLQDLLELISKKDVLFIIEDWNAKVGSQETPGVTGKFGLGIRNEAGQRLIEFCQENTLVIANTLFQQHKRRLYTWTSPDGQHRNQTGAYTYINFHCHTHIMCPTEFQVPYLCYLIILIIKLQDVLTYQCVFSVTQLCPTLCDPMDCSLPGSSVHGISQARILQ